jgi:hypothetical protein
LGSRQILKSLSRVNFVVMVKHLQRLNKLSSGLALVALSATVGGCALFGGGESSNPNVQPSPQAAAPQTFPSPTLPTTAKAGTKVVLTRPTNPDERVKAIKSGRNDPFAVLVSPKKEGEQGGSASSSSSAKAGNQPKTPQEKFTQDMTKRYDRFLNEISQTYKDEVKAQKGAAGGQQAAGSQATINPSSVTGGQAVAKSPEPSQVQVMGIASVGGVPQAIVQAPGEPTSRTVGIGDSLSDGSLIVSNIDMSNPAEPIVIFQQGTMTFSVGVGRSPSIMASR